MNAFLSVFMLCGGLATVLAARHWDAAAYRPVFIMMVFWISNAAYQLAWPFPTQGVRWITLFFAMVLAVLYIFALRFSARPARRESPLSSA